MINVFHTRYLSKIFLMDSIHHISYSIKKMLSNDAQILSISVEWLTYIVFFCYLQAMVDFHLNILQLIIVKFHSRQSTSRTTQSSRVSTWKTTIKNTLNHWSVERRKKAKSHIAIYYRMSLYDFFLLIKEIKDWLVWNSSACRSASYLHYCSLYKPFLCTSIKRLIEVQIINFNHENASCPYSRVHYQRGLTHLWAHYTV